MQRKLLRAAAIGAALLAAMAGYGPGRHQGLRIPTGRQGGQEGRGGHSGEARPQASGRAIPDAVIFAKRIDMGPDDMATMAAPLEPVPSTEPGVYRFKTDLTMAGDWALSLGAKVQGETGTVENKLIVKATQ